MQRTAPALRPWGSTSPGPTRADSWSPRARRGSTHGGARPRRGPHGPAHRCSPWRRRAPPGGAGLPLAAPASSPREPSGSRKTRCSGSSSTSSPDPGPRGRLTGSPTIRQRRGSPGHARLLQIEARGGRDLDAARGPGTRNCAQGHWEHYWPRAYQEPVEGPRLRSCPRRVAPTLPVPEGKTRACGPHGADYGEFGRLPRSIAADPH